MVKENSKRENRLQNSAELHNVPARGSCWRLFIIISTNHHSLNTPFHTYSQSSQQRGTDV